MLQKVKEFVNFLLFDDFHETTEDEELRLKKRDEDALTHRDRLYFYPQSMGGGWPIASYDEIFH